MTFHTVTAAEEEIRFADLGYRAVLATIAAAQACTPTAKAAAMLVRPVSPDITPMRALCAALRPSAATRQDVRALHGSFHPTTAGRFGGWDLESSMKTPFTLAFQPSFKAADIEPSLPEPTPASVREA